MKHCIVGDVHGEYRALLNLVAKTPSGSQLVFVGDLVDRGSQSAQVIKFIRKHRLASVRGNHEEMMIEYGSSFIYAVENNQPIEQENKWLQNGGKETLLSYGLVTLKGKKWLHIYLLKSFFFNLKRISSG